MKTETQIVKDLIHLFKLEERKKSIPHHYTDNGRCIEHKASCQRFLGFLEQGVFIYDGLLNRGNKGLIISLKNKITDLEQAIKLYEDNGI